MTFSILFSKIHEVLTQARLWHYQANFFTFHSAIGKFYESFAELGDTLLESFVGRTQDKIINDSETSLNLIPLEQANVMQWIEELREWWVAIKEEVSEEDADLAAIIDQILEEINRLRYFVTLK